MAANNVPNLSIPGTITNPKTGDRGFDHDQLKVWMVNVGNNIITTNTSSNVTSAQLAAVSAVANGALTIAVEANTTANLAYGQANNAYVAANLANTVAYEAILIAEIALHQIASNASSNLVAVYHEGNLVIANANVNFNDTGTVNANVYISTANNQANIEFNANGTAIVGPTAQTANTALFNANLAYLQANTAYAAANLGIAIGEAAFDEANVAAAAAAIANATAVLGVEIAEEAYSQANLAYALANTLVANVSSGNTSNIVISGNSTNVIIDLSFLGSPGSNGNVQITSDQFIANANQTVFDLSTTPTNANYVIVTRNGLLEAPSFYTLNANVLILSTGTNANDVVEVREFANGGATGPMGPQGPPGANGANGPGGSDSQIQYNSNGVFAGSANLTYIDGESLNVTANTTTVNGNLTVLQNAFIDGDLVITGNLIIGANLSVGGVMNVSAIIGLMSINNS